MVKEANPSQRKLLGEGRLSVLIVDSHWVTRHGLKQLLAEEFRGIAFGEAGTTTEVLKELERRAWGVVSLGLNIPGNRGLQILEEILRRQPNARVLVLAIYAQSQYATKALSLGALAYLTKDCPRVELVRAFRHVLIGERYRSAAQEFAPAVLPDSPSAHESLSPQEFRVMLALSAGRRPRDIATDLKLSINTVSTYKTRILKKLQLQSAADLIRYAIDHQL